MRAIPTYVPRRLYGAIGNSLLGENDRDFPLLKSYTLIKEIEGYTPSIRTFLDGKLHDPDALSDDYGATVTRIGAHPD
ncbi:unnamed protein product [Haemonchus placei]|uniref:DUF5069 domain-containing protein n=1 Tax=Haemonchus placei TaxID=6290 RepID=A0A0N4WNN1_HAEPC|nr:unnamed protein product [Haemonchus placei]